MLHPWLETGAGDLFSLAWNPWLEVVYVGCQNTSLQWFEFSEDQMGQRIQEICSGVSTPTRKVHKFFDSYPQYTHKPADSFANNFGVFSDLEEERDPSNSTSTLNIPAENVIDSAHYGYVYCMAMVPSNRIGSNNSQLSSNENHRLLTGSGDETIKVCTSMAMIYVSHAGILSCGLAYPPDQNSFILSSAHMVPCYRLRPEVTLCSPDVKMDTSKYSI